jgi:uncharacterized OB-fold protein
VTTSPSTAARPVEEPGTGNAFHEQTWDLSYRHALGATTSAFLRGLSEGRILGRRCDTCDRILVPARSFCDRCHVGTGQWFEVGSQGVVEMFTVVYEPFRGLPAPPYALAYVTLDGADTALPGYVKGIPLDDPATVVDRLAIGRRLRVAFADHPEGTVLDYWFESVDTGSDG